MKLFFAVVNFNLFYPVPDYWPSINHWVEGCVYDVQPSNALFWNRFETIHNSTAIVITGAIKTPRQKL